MMKGDQGVLVGKPLVLVLAIAAFCCGCSRPAPSAAPAPAAAALTNRVDINAAVRQNLGITFAKVESRPVSRTLRLPGRFELLPDARREYREAAAGIVEVLVQQYQPVDAGTPLYRVDSPRWRDAQRDLAEADATLKLARADAESIAPLMAAHESHHAELQNAVDVWKARVATLEKLQADGGVRGEDLAQARSSLAAANAELAETLEKEAELQVRKARAAAALESAQSRWTIALHGAASISRLRTAELVAPTPSDPASPRWQSIAAIDVRAVEPGIVDVIHVASGGMVSEHATILETVRPDRVRFRAVAMQSDLARVVPGSRAMVTSASSAEGDSASSIEGTISLAPTADPVRRTVDLIHIPGAPPNVPWARAGMAAFLEVITQGTGGDELAIPLRCVARDGTTAVIFRRDPADPDKAIRLEADLGIDDGRWVVIKSGVAEGNEIVLDGVYQLMVATSSTMTKGGHFHPDGTFHEGED